MKRRRLCLLAGTAFLVAGTLGGCLQFAPSAPQALFTASPAEHLIPFTASFDATLCQRTPNEVLTYVWNFGDGGSGTGALVDHAYAQDGTYDVVLTVYDAKGASSQARLSIQALNPLPTATFAYSPRSLIDSGYIIGTSEKITFDASASADDEEVASYDWNFSDGQYAVGPVVVHQFAYPGTYNVTVTVTDNDGGQSTYVQPIKVIGGGPCNSGSGGTCQ